jgi:uncharacterized membrane protein YciS (DUF1049 family)
MSFSSFVKKFKQGRMPTVLGLVLAVSFLAAAYLVTDVFFVRTRARQGSVPQNVKITNVTDRSFTVSFTTEVSVAAFVKLFSPQARTVFDVRSQGNQAEKYQTHYFVVSSLSPQSEYEFLINSDGEWYGTEGKGQKKYQVKTAAVYSGAPPEAKLAFGNVVDKNNQPVGGALVYLEVPGIAPLSSLTSSSGNWVVPLAFAFNPSLSAPADYREGEVVETILVNGGSKGMSRVFNFTKDNKPVPPITLGSDYDFRDIAKQSTKDNSDEKTGRLKLDGQQPSGVPIEIKVFSPEEGETVRTTKPEIIGTGPQDMEFEIILESSTKYEAKVKPDSSGKWTWIPPGELSPGEHQLTVKYFDKSSGEEKTITRRFVVLAAGDQEPAFTASPSAGTITPTPTEAITPTPTSTNTPTPTPTVVETSPTPTSASGSALPVSGLADFSFIAIILGAIFFLGGILLLGGLI